MGGRIPHPRKLIPWTRAAIGGAQVQALPALTYEQLPPRLFGQGPEMFATPRDMFAMPPEMFLAGRPVIGSLARSVSPCSPVVR